MERIKIGQGYYQKGYGRGFKKNPNIYLIDGYLYARDKVGASQQYTPTTGELIEYVRVNIGARGKYHQCNEAEAHHEPHKKYINQ